MPIIENKNWPIPMHSSQKEEIEEMLKSGQAVRLTYMVTSTGDFCAEVNPEHEKKREQIEKDGKSRL